MKQKTGAAIQNRAVPLQACGPHEPHPRQVDILLDNGMAVTCEVTLVLVLLQGPVTCVKYNGRPQHLPLFACLSQQVLLLGFFHLRNALELKYVGNRNHHAVNRVYSADPLDLFEQQFLNSDSCAHRLVGVDD